MYIAVGDGKKGEVRLRPEDAHLEDQDLPVYASVTALSQPNLQKLYCDPKNICETLMSITRNSRTLITCAENRTSAGAFAGKGNSQCGRDQTSGNSSEEAAHLASTHIQKALLALKNHL